MIYNGKRVDGAHFTDARGDLWLVKVKGGKHGSKYAMIIWGGDPGNEIDWTNDEEMETARNSQTNDFIMLPGDGLGLSRVAWWALG
jgi:hypothetical protein